MIAADRLHERNLPAAFSSVLLPKIYEKEKSEKIPAKCVTHLWGFLRNFAVEMVRLRNSAAPWQLERAPLRSACTSFAASK